MKSLKLLGFAFTACIALAYFALSIPVNKAKGDVHIWNNNPVIDTCKRIQVIPSSVKEAPNCGADVANISSYDFYATLINTSQQTLTINMDDASYWCPSWGWPCNDHQQGGYHTVVLHPGDTYPVHTHRTPGVYNGQQMQACGTYQSDIHFNYTYNGVKCVSNNPGGSSEMTMVWGGCQSFGQPGTSWKNGSCTNFPTITPTVTPVPTNTPTPTPPSPYITVVKHVVGGPNHAYDFWMHINNGNVISFPGNESGTTKPVNPGAFSVTEDQKLGYVETTSGSCSGTISAGQHLYCYVTNTYNYPHVTVIKHVVGGPLHASDFTMYIDTVGGTLSFPGNESGTTKAIYAGNFDVNESGNASYEESLSGDCNTTAQPGHSYTCTVTNTYNPHLTPTPTPTNTPTPTDTPTGTPTDTPTPTNTPTDTPTPTSSNNNNCDNSQDNNGGDANNNCNNNNNNQSQNQTQNNNQTVNVTYQVLGSSTANNLPSTGTPLSDLLFLGSMLPAGIFLRRKSK